MSLDIQTWEKWYEEHREEILEDFFQFLRFESIGTDPNYRTQTRECAQWLSEYLSNIGLETTLWETSNQPVVFAQDLRAGKDRPTLMIYHHYDVQPVDPLDLWETPPFEPSIRKGKVFARGAQDNKGQCFYTVTALKAFYQLAETRNFNLKIFIEGEEESGSTGTKEAIEKHADDLKCDAMLCIDSSMFAEGVGAITLGIRGILTTELTLRTADSDMHSGGLGGIAYNPIRALCTILSKCWDEEGKITIPHFYDAVDPLTDRDKQELDLELDEEEMKRKFGLRALSPEPGYTIGQSVSVRPTFEINGIDGGYTGEGFKTVLPAMAKAKLSCRLVPSQNPEEIFQNLKAHLLSHLPKGIELELELDQGSPAFRSSGDSMIAKLTTKAYEEVLGVPCKKMVIGGSIPIVADLSNVTGADVLVMGFGLDTDQIHAPNEHFGLDRFKQGFLTIGQIFKGLNE